MNQNKKLAASSPSGRALVVMTLSAAFLFYKYILQNFPSVMATQLMETLMLGCIC